MTDYTTSSAPGLGERPEERDAREARHALLIDLLAAYVDRELPPETTSQIDAHLVGCARCRRELSVHHALRERLGAEPVVAAPPAFRERIARHVAQIPVPAAVDAPAHDNPLRPLLRRIVIAAGALVALVVVVVGVRTVVADGQAPRAVDAATLAQPRVVPLLRDALADYRRVTASDLPGRARDLDAVRTAIPFPVTTIRAHGLRLLAAWTTDLGGEPAAVLAYRWDDRLVLEYIVSEERFFRHPALRASIAGRRVLETHDGSQAIVAWPTDAAGAVLVADVAPSRLAPLAAAALANGAARDAP